MPRNGLFINGVFESVLHEIVAVQAQLPDYTMFLQPYAGTRIVELAENPPSDDDPVPLFLSLSDRLAEVQYVGEIIGWNDKREIPSTKRAVLDRIIRALQPGEDGLFEEVAGTRCVNLLYVRRLRRLGTPVSVDAFVNAKDGSRLSSRFCLTNRFLRPEALLTWRCTDGQALRTQ